MACSDFSGLSGVLCLEVPRGVASPLDGLGGAANHSTHDVCEVSWMDPMIDGDEPLRSEAKACLSLA